MPRKEVYTYPNITSPANPIIYDSEICTGCNTCVEHCQVDVLIPNPEKGQPPVILHPDECWYCGCCVNDCPTGAITINCNRGLTGRTRLHGRSCEISSNKIERTGNTGQNF
jgi:NAD-dependent dihydropyrimidine dehydrogenase PreA subunit